MAKKKKDTVEFRFYEIPQGDSALVLCGESWIRVYGHDEFHLHFHNLMEVGICRYGKGDMHLDENVKHYQDGAVTIIPENYPHITVSEGEDVNFWEYIFWDPKSTVEKLFPDDILYQKSVLEALNKVPIFTDITEDVRIANIIDAIIEEEQSKRPFYQKMVEGYTMALMLEMIRREENLISVKMESRIKGTNMSQIALAIDYVNKNYSKQIRVGDMATLCNMSETHFRRIFEDYINMSPMDYVNMIRVQKACELMKKSNDSMDLVAAKCGFVTTSTFNRNFKKFLDTSPYQWKINPENYESKLLNFRISALKGW